MTELTLLLDPQIRDWVVIPMVIMVVLVGLGRSYVQNLLKTQQLITDNDFALMRCKQILAHSMRLRANGLFLPPTSVQKRKLYFSRKKVGVLREKTPPMANPMSNPMAMVDMMKGNVTFMLPNFAMMGFVGNFFAGFVCLKVPFSMPSSRFRLMLQRGVDLNSIDVSYVSSLSWYFLVTFGLNSILRLILGDDADLDDSKMMQMQMGMGMGSMGQPGFDAGAAFKQEREGLGIYQHLYVGERAERELLGDRYPAMVDDETERNLANIGHLNTAANNNY